MDPKHRSLITSNLQMLIKLIDINFIMPFVMQDRIFTPHMLDDIYAFSSGKMDRMQNFLLELPTRGPEAFTKFVDILKKTGNEQAVKLLLHDDGGDIATPEIPSIHSNQQSFDQPVVNCNPFSIHNGQSVKTGATDQLIVTPASQWRFGDGIYKMDSTPRGYCLIINNVDFGGLKDYRHGSDLDNTRLQMVFTQLGYSVLPKCNLKKSEMKEELSKFATLLGHKSVDSSVVIILSHGVSGGVSGVDDEALDFAWIFEMFNNENSPDLKMKPKMFFIQACRGGKFDSGVPTSIEKYDSSAVEHIPQVLNRIPIISDMIICYSTNDGFISIRDENLGSWYCQELISVLMEKACVDDLVTILQCIEQRVRRRSGGTGEKQSTSFECKGWAKQLYFNPGLVSK